MHTLGCPAVTADDNYRLHIDLSKYGHYHVTHRVVIDAEVGRELARKRCQVEGGGTFGADVGATGL